MTVEELVALLESEDEMTAADYRIPMSIGESPHAEVKGQGPRKVIEGVYVPHLQLHPPSG